MKNKTAIYLASALIILAGNGICQSNTSQKLRESAGSREQLNSLTEVDQTELVRQSQASVQTTAVKNIASNSASTGYLINSNGVQITAHGICINKAPKPTTANTKFAADKGPGPAFNVQLPGLTPNMTYYIRAYITSAAGTVYGNELSFTTLPAKK